MMKSLPFDVFYQLVPLLSLETLKSFALVNKEFYDLAEPKLFQGLSIYLNMRDVENWYKALVRSSQLNRAVDLNYRASDDVRKLVAFTRSNKRSRLIHKLSFGFNEAWTPVSGSQSKLDVIRGPGGQAESKITVTPLFARKLAPYFLAYIRHEFISKMVNLRWLELLSMFSSGEIARLANGRPAASQDRLFLETPWKPSPELGTLLEEISARSLWAYVPNLETLVWNLHTYHLDNYDPSDPRTDVFPVISHPLHKLTQVSCAQPLTLPAFRHSAKWTPNLRSLKLTTLANHDHEVVLEALGSTGSSQTAEALVELKIEVLHFLNSEVNPTISIFTDILGRLSLLEELEFHQESLSSHRDREVALDILGTALPNLKVLLWVSTWEEGTILGQLFIRKLMGQENKRIESLGDSSGNLLGGGESEVFPALRYASFAWPSRSNPALLRLRKKHGSPKKMWDYTSRRGWGVQEMRPVEELDGWVYTPISAGAIDPNIGRLERLP